jgi:hypothetical protein
MVDTYKEFLILKKINLPPTLNRLLLIACIHPVIIGSSLEDGWRCRSIHASAECNFRGVLEVS